MTTMTMTKGTTALTFAERTIAAAGLFDEAFVRGLTGESPEGVRAARRTWARFREMHGYRRDGSAALFTPPTAQPKLHKSERWALGLMLTPARGLPVGLIGRTVNLCPRASAGCEAACLGPNSGKGVLDGTRRARHIRTAFLLTMQIEAGLILGDEVRRAIAAHPEGVSVRLNTVSDIRWEFVAPLALRHMLDMGVAVYDYTAWSPADRRPMPGYHLTYSAKEAAHTSDEYLDGVLEQGHNVAMPFAVRKGQPLPLFWRGWPVIDGDVTDDRTTDPRGVVVGLRQKGRVKDETGFIRQP